MKKSFLLILTLILAFSCKKETTHTETDNLFKFKDYIYYTTSGNISVTEPITIGLANEIKNYTQEQPISEDIISISPDIEGTLTASNARTLKFTPKEYLQPDTEYKITVHLSELYTNVPDEFEDFTFAFKTIKPAFTINLEALQSYSSNLKYYEGVLRTSDYIPLEKVKSFLKASQKGKKLSVKWMPEDNVANIFPFRIDSIHRPKEDTEIKISWSGASYDIDNEGSETKIIPGLANFSIMDVKVMQTPAQHLVINFSDPLKKGQNFDGLVTIGTQKDLKYTVNGNLLKVYPNNRVKGNLQVEVFPGIKSNANYKLTSKFSETIAFEQLHPAVRLISNGVILPNSQNLKFNFEAVNLKAVDVRVIKIFENNILQFLQDENLNSTNKYNIQRVGRRVAKKTIELVKTDFEDDGKWKTYAVDLSKMIKTDPGAIYRIELEIKPEYSLYTCDGTQLATNVETESYNDYFEEEEFYNNGETLSAEEERLEELYWDNLSYDYRKYEYYDWDDRNNPCKRGYYLDEDKIVRANILASDLGVIVKKGLYKKYHFAVTDLLSTKPVSNAKITLYNYQQQEIGSVSTDNQGFAMYQPDSRAYFAVVKKGKNMMYVTLNEGNSLSMSKFDISGRQIEEGIQGYIYGERGVWRPGDSIHLTFILNDKDNPLPKTHPVQLTFTNPQGKLLDKQIVEKNKSGFYAFTLKTDQTSPTGNYTAVVNVGAVKFYKNIKVETVKPNRLKIKLDFKDEILRQTKPLEGNLQINWLHGAPAKNVKADITTMLSTTSTAFEKYKNYVFTDPIRNFSYTSIEVFNGSVNTEGNAIINKKLSLNNKPPGMLNATFLTKAYEAGGDFSIDVTSKILAPYENFVGLQSPEEDLYGSYSTDKDYTFDILTVTDSGKPIAQKNLELKVYKVEWRWWWDSEYDDLASYINKEYHEPVISKTLNTGADGKANFKINIPNYEGGRYLIRVLNPNSGHATGRTAYFYKDWWRTPGGSDGQAATTLLFSADKEEYEVGEKAKIVFPSGSNGRALISIENSTGIINQQWVTTEKGETTTEISITKDMAPNVYVSISLIQPHSETANDLPIRMYGVIPLLVNDKNTILQPQVTMPDVLRPEKPFTVKVSEKNNKAMTYTLAIVDDGLLDLTNFKTPNAWDEFFAKEALGVLSWDIFDYVIGAYGGSISQIFGIGGGDDGGVTQPQKANRFKPVVRYLGPFTLKKGKTQSHNVTLPKYVGSVRTMVIAGNTKTEAYGSAEKTTPVRESLMVLASLPRKLSPGEKVILPVTVFAMEKKVKNANISLKLSKGIRIVGDKTQQLSFSQPDEKMAYFELDVSQAKGINTIEVLAQGSGEKSSYTVEIDVENPNPISNQVSTIILEPNSNQTLDFSTFGEPGTNSASVEFSTLPPMDFTRRMNYLIRYPHGCIEQITSSAFPQLYIEDILDLTYDKKQEIEKNVKATIKKMSQYQRSNGGLSYWPGNHEVDDWGTSYAGHFMLEAEKKGYVLPLNFKNNWLSYQKDAASNWRAGYRQYNTSLEQAYRLYTLALIGQPDLSAMNRLRENGGLSNDAKWRLAAAYALAGQPEVAKTISQTANIHFESNNYDYFTYGSVDRNRAMALETMVLTDNSGAREIAEYIAKELSSDRWMSTQTTAYSLLALAKMVEKAGGKDLAVSYSLNNAKAETVATKKSVAMRNLAIADGSNQLKVSNNNPNTLYVTLNKSGKLPIGKELAEQRNLSAKVNFYTKAGKLLNVDNLPQGTNFLAQVTITNLKQENVKNVALTEIFPSGWEIVNTRFTEFNQNNYNNLNYIDIRDDRINYYFDLTKRENYFVRNSGKWITVTP
ncbi:MAG: hypothetical protein CR989_00400 [Flavobacteriales bacterium]|nr:MAG: hypothetical protein CR989_00400 [Flavobacteriales bacterium]